MELKRLRNNFDSPMLDLSMLAGFEAQEKIARVFGVDAEIVDRTLGIGFGVGGQPSLWGSKSAEFTCGENESSCSPVSALLRF